MRAETRAATSTRSCAPRYWRQIWLPASSSSLSRTPVFEKVQIVMTTHPHHSLQYSTEGSYEAAYPCRYKKGAASPSVPSCAAPALCKPYSTVCMYVRTSAAKSLRGSYCSCCSLPILSVLLDGHHLPLRPPVMLASSPTDTQREGGRERLTPVPMTRRNFETRSSRVGIQHFYIHVMVNMMCRCNRFDSERSEHGGSRRPRPHVSLVSPS